MNHKHKLVLQSSVVGVVSLLIGLILLVACGETPSPSSPPLPTSTVQILTLPVPQTSNGNLASATPGISGPTGAAATATAAVFVPPLPTNASDTTTAAPVVPGQIDTNTPRDTVGATATVGNSNTAITTAIVPTPNVPPPTPPIGISPNPPPIPTQPVGISPAVINNTASLEEQRFQLDLGDYQAAASLEYPKASAGPYPTILMFQPYGLYDLDATATTSRFGIGSRNYKVIADQLALRGFAVVRYTKRGFDQSGQSQNPAQATPLDQLMSDAKAALVQIQSNPLVDPRKLILLGEDEGATVAMRLAQQQNVAGLILIGPMTDTQAAWHYQTVEAPTAYAQLSLDRNKDGQLSVQEWGNAPRGTFLASFQNVALDGIKLTSLVGSGNAQAADIEHELKPFLEKMYAAGPTAYPAQADYLASLFKLGNTTSLLTQYKKPILILQGALDQQVPPAQGENLDRFLAQQGNPDHKLISYPKLGHNLYKLDKGGADVPGPLDVNLDPPNNPLDDLMSWLKAHFA